MNNRAGVWMGEYGEKTPARGKVLEPPCAITGRGHIWRLEKFIRYVERGTCDCGAVRFFATVFDREVIKLAETYNERKGKPGRRPKEGIMTTATLTNERTVTPTVTSIVPLTATSTNERPPVPPRDGNSYRYYEANKTDILRDYLELGEKGMRKRWNISQATWLVRNKSGRWSGLAVRWGIVASPGGAPAGEKKRKGHHAGPPDPAAVAEAVEKLGRGKPAEPSIIPLPAFPSFESLPPVIEVKIAWLESYARIAVGSRE